MATATQKRVWGTVGQTQVTQAGGRLAVSHDSQHIAVSKHGEVTMFDNCMQRRYKRKIISEPDRLELFWCPNNAFLYCVHDLRDDVLVLNAQSGATIETWHLKNVSCVASNESGTFVAFGLKSGDVAVYRTSDKKHMQTVTICCRGKAVTDIHFLSENSFLAANDNGDIGIFDVK